MTNLTQAGLQPQGNMSDSSAPTNFFLILRYVCIALNAPAALFALAGNLLILAALRKTSTLHTPSKILLGNLALTDFCVGLVLQPWYVTILAIELTRGQLVSRLAFNSLSFPLSGVSLSTMTAISVDRLLALYRWRTYRTTVTMKRVGSCVAVLWLLGVVTRLVALYATFVAYAIASSTAIFLSASISSSSFLLIYRKLSSLKDHAEEKESQKATRTDSSSINVKKFRKSANDMLYLCCTIWLCYFPFIVWNMLMGLFSLFPAGREPCMTLIMFNSSLNPVLYCWRITEVRRAAKRVLRSALGRDITCCWTRVRVHEHALVGVARSHVAWHVRGDIGGQHRGQPH